jgi:homoaconitase/3-isopropylmalate dehydratase large subunit
MGMTITEKILAAHAGKAHVEPGEIVDVTIDLALANDITAPLSLEEFEKVGATRVFDPERVVLVWTTSPRTRTSCRRRTARRSESSLTNTGSPTSTRAVHAASSTRFFLKKGSSSRVT